MLTRDIIVFTLYLQNSDSQIKNFILPHLIRYGNALYQVAALSYVAKTKILCSQDEDVDCTLP